MARIQALLHLCKHRGTNPAGLGGSVVAEIGMVSVNAISKDVVL
jgi:hypothetical protein